MKKAGNIHRGNRHYEPFLFLMILTILVIAGFQVYWLRNTLTREKRTMQIKANAAFQETVRNLQAKKLKLKEPFALDSLHKERIELVMGSDESDVRKNRIPNEEVVTMVNDIGNKVRDSLGLPGKRNVIIRMDHKIGRSEIDSSHRVFQTRTKGANTFLEFLYGVDSLQDSLKISEITAAYHDNLKNQNLAIPFSINKLAGQGSNDDGPAFSDVTVGFAHPATYHLELGNTFPYLLKRLTLPILFSLFLVGVTILSFILLYRNLIRQQRLTELKNEFIGNITHELKTPIATVGVAIEALRNFNALDDPKRTKEYLDISANELQRLSLLVDKVLKLSMFEKKEVELKKESFDLRVLVDEVISIMKLQFEKQHARVSVKAEGENFIIEADRLHITSVLYNLLDNALKYTMEHPVIEIKLSALSRDFIELKVTDNGVGIAKEYQPKIFEKFFRVPMGDKHNIKGYGLGLSYVFEIVQQHRGSIEVESEVEKGTTFTVRLPRVETDIANFRDEQEVTGRSA